VRGVRVNIVDVWDRKPGTLPLDALTKLALKVRPFGWHMEFLMHVDEFPDLDRMLGDFPVPTVYGHLGYMKTDHGIANPGFQALLRLARTKRVSVKLSGYSKFSRAPYPFEDCWPFVHAIVEAFTLDHCVWASDWPFLRAPQRQDYGPLVELVERLFPDPVDRHLLLWTTPRRMFGFGEEGAG